MEDKRAEIIMGAFWVFWLVLYPIGMYFINQH